MLNLRQVLQREPFWRPQKAPKSFSAEALPRTPLEELTTLPRPRSRLVITTKLAALILAPRFQLPSGLSDSPGPWGARIVTGIKCVAVIRYS